ncbi:heterokaryon incompatibility protein-domain-containing protein [Bisporella sp. PMI_857]|nr:heterokaryon incompatibility protein-domain-containing protein [Bisporella sp. PMI_857]
MIGMSSPLLKPTFPSAPVYQQCPINYETRTVRLIELLPGIMPEPLACRLFAQSLDSNPQYTALLLGVTSGLHAALVYLRNSKVSRTLWVDAICIDQSDIQERNHQVAQMKSIYQAADKVVAWLGEEADDSDQAMAYLSSMCWVDANPRDKSDNVMKALEKLWARPYWTRVWVVQELAVARRVSFHCGLKSVSVTAVREFLSWKRLSGFATQESSAWIPRKLLLLTTSVDSDVLLILRDSWHLQATQSLDKVYGLLGLFPEQFLQHLEPDYKKSFPDLMYDVVRSYLHAYRNFNILCGFSQLRRDNRWNDSPSWIPNITRPLVGMAEEYNTSGDRRDSKAIVTGTILKAGGTVISKVAHVQGPFEFMASGKSYEHFMAFRASLEEMKRTSLRHLERQYPALSQAEKELQFFTMLTGDRMHSQSTKICPFSCQQLWDAVTAINDELQLAQFLDVVEYFEFLFLRLRNRCFFYTVEGHIGLGPANMRRGDVACVLYGCRLPIVLRERLVENAARTYQFIGPSYVVGAMSGEYASMEGMMFNIE